MEGITTTLDQDAGRPGHPEVRRATAAWTTACTTGTSTRARPASRSWSATAQLPPAPPGSTVEFIGVTAIEEAIARATEAARAPTSRTFATAVERP